ncbi:unnamed protein product [Ostreobium quekettii]|uniref:RRM domain-containing protein n=1 Tax=Ostreobium quekettii TaxID=121088 RepID=A0A8S1J8P6_9CHLO|nr:unnamed protein product [Ostreobium quekettii]|eukprot:evm.model.scf_1727.5 EVM.evm.TU.scf_1727.5   scf_1727:25297-28953(+)
MTRPKYTSENTVYVGDLSPVTGEMDLFQLFSKVGPVTSVRVVRDSVTRASKGYAYVNFDTTWDTGSVNRAVSAFSYTGLHGSIMRVMALDKALKFRKDANVFVKGLHPSIDSKTLHDTFEVFGHVACAKVLFAPDGASLGYGYIQYLEAPHAQTAIKMADGTKLKGLKIKVAPFLSRSQRMHHPRLKCTSVFVKHLPASVTEDHHLAKMFEGYGEMTSAFVAKDAEGAPTGFGFINFKSPDVAAKVVREMNGKTVAGKCLIVEPAHNHKQRKVYNNRCQDAPKARRPEVNEQNEGVQLLVKCIPFTMGEDALMRLFEHFGTITSVNIMRDEYGGSRGFGFITFATDAAAQQAIVEMNGACIMSGNRLYVAVAKSRQQERQAPLMPMQQPACGPNFGMYPSGLPVPPLPYPPPALMTPPLPMLSPQGPHSPHSASTVGPQGPAGMMMCPLWSSPPECFPVGVPACMPPTTMPVPDLQLPSYPHLPDSLASPSFSDCMGEST